jgi:hypothetical protein
MVSAAVAAFGNLKPEVSASASFPLSRRLCFRPSVSRDRAETRAPCQKKDKVTFPRPPLQSWKVGFPDSGFRPGYPQEAFPGCVKRSLAYTSLISVYLPARP